MNGWWLHGGMILWLGQVQWGESGTRIALKIITPRFVSFLLSLSVNLPWTLSFWSLSIKTTPIESYLLHPAINPPPSLGILQICLAYITFYRWSICWQPCAKPNKQLGWNGRVNLFSSCGIAEISFWTYVPETSKGIKVQPPGLFLVIKWYKFHQISHPWRIQVHQW